MQKPAYSCREQVFQARESGGTKLRCLFVLFFVLPCVQEHKSRVWFLRVELEQDISCINTDSLDAPKRTSRIHEQGWDGEKIKRQGASMTYYQNNKMTIKIKI